ncbi:MAG: peptide-methionine (S)-S-oxide reductase MsrA [Opitutales bacterium]
MFHLLRTLILSAAAACFGVGCSPASNGTEANEAGGSPAPEASGELATAVLGAGCFWCVEAFYERLDGVREVISGYAGGEKQNPTYAEVSRGETRHAEAVKIFYDPDVVSYRELIDFFWKTHDAGRGDGVWPDFGPQYRSMLLYQSETEKEVIRASKQAHEDDKNIEVATEIKALNAFYPAEEYHQDFAEKNPDNSYVRRILNPKLKKLGFEVNPDD